MKRTILIALILALLSAGIIPAFSAGGQVAAASGNPQVGCDTTQLTFHAIKGVNPSSQTIGVYNAGTGILWWRVSDNVSWLSAAPSFGSSSGEVDKVTVTISSKYMAVGTYSATITVSPAFVRGTSATVAVTLVIEEPQRVGPILLGLERITKPDTYRGQGAWLIIGSSGLNDLSSAGIELAWKDSWEMSVTYGQDTGFGSIPILGGTLTGSGKIPSATILSGSLIDLGMMLSQMGIQTDNLGKNWIVMLNLKGNDGSYFMFMGMLLEDLGGLMRNLPALLSLLGGGGTASAEISIREVFGMISTGGGALNLSLAPLMDIVSALMPVMNNLLPKLTPLISLIEPLLTYVPPIMVLMPPELMMKLMPM